MSDDHQKDKEPVEQPTQQAEAAPDEQATEQPELSPLEQAQKEAADNLAGWQRCMADYKNLVAESEKRIGDARKFGTQALLMELLPMVDHFKYALKGMPADMADSPWMKGVEYIQQNFMKILEENGVKVIPTVGEQFNTELHEPIEEVEEGPDGKKGKSGVIAEEMATGFTLNDKVIQVAKVKVFK